MRVHAHVDTETKKSVKTELKQALLSGISFAVPLIVAGGTVLAVSVLLAQILGLQHLFDQENSWLWMYRKLGGGMLGILMVPVLAAYTAYSLADKPALDAGLCGRSCCQYDRFWFSGRYRRWADRGLSNALGEKPHPAQ